MLRKLIATTCGTAGVAALLMTAGCSAASAGDDDPSATPPTATDASPTSPAPSSPAPSSPAPTSPAPGASGTDDPDADLDTGPDTGTAAGAEPEGRRCLTPDLTGSLKVVEGGASTAHYEIAIVLENAGADACVMQGWPGVSFVGDGDGTQIGAAATLDRLSPHDAVTLDPGSAAQAVVRVADAENYDEECGHTQAEGFRVYPPGEKRSLFVPGDQMTITACSNPDDALLDVQAFRPAG